MLRCRRRPASGALRGPRARRTRRRTARRSAPCRGGCRRRPRGAASSLPLRRRNMLPIASCSKRRFSFSHHRSSSARASASSGESARRQLPPSGVGPMRAMSMMDCQRRSASIEVVISGLLRWCDATIWARSTRGYDDRRRCLRVYRVLSLINRDVCWMIASAIRGGTCRERADCRAVKRSDPDRRHALSACAIGGIGG